MRGVKILFVCNKASLFRVQVGKETSGSCDRASLTLRLLISYIYGAPSKARNANVVYIWTYVWQR